MKTRNLWIISLIIVLFLFNSFAWCEKLTEELYLRVDFFTPVNEDFPNKYQHIDGFGAHFVQDTDVFYGLDEADRDTILDKLFNVDELGANIIRIRANRALCPDANNCPTTLPRMPGDLHFIKDAKERNSNIKLIAAPWSAPFWMMDIEEEEEDYIMLCHNKDKCALQGCDLIEGGNNRSCVDEHAWWLYKYLDGFEHGNFYLGVPYPAPIEYFTLQNEPDNDWCKMWGWCCFSNTEEYSRRFDQFISYFPEDKKDVTKPKIVFPDVLWDCNTNLHSILRY